MTTMSEPRSPLTRERVIDAARKVMSEVGLEQLSLRRLAGEFGVTAPALYAHVNDKADLLGAIAEQGFEELVARYQAHDDIPADEVVEFQCRAYVRHALDDPDLYRVMLMFRPAAVEIPDVDNELPAATAAFELALRAVEEAREAGTIHPDRDPLMTGLALWTTVHGLASVLLLTDVTDANYQEALISEVLGLTLSGLATPP